MATTNTRAVTLETDIAAAFYKAADTPRSLALKLLLEAGEIRQLVEMKIDPMNYLDGYQFAIDYCATSILKKSQFMELPEAQQTALEAYLEAECQCKETNARLLYFWESFSEDNRTHQAVLRTLQYVKQILGPLDYKKFDMAERSMGFGPGATTSVKGHISYGRKYSQPILDVTPGLLNYAVFRLPELWRRKIEGFRLMNHSIVQFVPKKATTRRAIEGQQDVNIYVQRGQGRLLRRQLKLFGNDLDSQERNQNAARQGSRDNSLATVDLRSASDTISYQVVKLLLPPDWVEYLEMSRVTESMLPDGTIVDLNKWSAMGNGYTFELESLLFYAVSLACTEMTRPEGLGDVTVFGDDIVVPTGSLELLIEVLKFLGFSTNNEKTFGTGLFRESCGADFWDGWNIRPFFLNGNCNATHSELCFSYGNKIRYWSYRLSGGNSCNALGLPAWLRAFSACHPKDRFRVPIGYESQGFVSDWDVASPRWGGVRNPWWKFKYYHRDSLTTATYIEGSYIGTLNNQGAGVGGIQPLKNQRCKRAVARSGTCTNWPDLGPWIDYRG